ncbi:MAG: NifB/NifX family molybdenum-iron cluster-binding protein [Dissulfurispiraceae bacterium]|jgi:predicted Fe-Mo cluster-binding NifX family protein|nr:NifB/NifX family molybdenum-iron cluster-binding protein [Dissulfurispiraceae bacterium]
MLKHLFLLCLCVLLIAPIAFSAQDTGKIAIAATGKTTSDQVSQLAGRGPYFQIFDSSGRFLETIENPYKTARGGAGVSIVNLLAKKGVTKIAAGETGPRMANAMRTQGIVFVEFRGSIDQAVRQIIGNK